jgi:hypothetical protein
MVALVLSGKVKDPELVKEITPLLMEKMGPEVLKMFKGFKSVAILMNENGSLIHLSLWESREYLDEIMQSDLGKIGLELREKMVFDGPMNIEYYEVIGQLELVAK